MKLVKAWFLGWILCGALGVATACGGKASVDGTDSHTHWLKACESDAECGDLSCICGVCTKACDQGADCASFGAATACEVPAGCNARGPTACVANGSGGGAAGAGNGAGGAASVADCAAMDARSGPAECATNIGYAWDGTQCRPILCDCQGSDCAALFTTADACDHAYRACYAEHGVSRACTTHADCVVQTRTCCASCSPGNDPGSALMATSADAPALRDAGICAGDPQAGCDDCAPPELYSVYAACHEGECRLLDLTPHATCQSAADCRLVTKDCCDCGGDFTSPGLAAADATFVRPDYCPATLSCAECAPTPPDNARPLCRSGTCAVGLLPL